MLEPWDRGGRGWASQGAPPSQGLLENSSQGCCLWGIEQAEGMVSSGQWAADIHWEPAACSWLEHRAS